MPKTTPHSEVDPRLCHHWHEYRLSCENYDRLVRRADGKCELCGVPRASLHIDHDHEIAWGAVRGLVCPKCNAHLRRIDSGERKPDKATSNFLENAFWKLLYIDPRAALEQYVKKNRKKAE